MVIDKETTTAVTFYDFNTTTLLTKLTGCVYVHHLDW
jgi:hypothetical protein